MNRTNASTVNPKIARILAAALLTLVLLAFGADILLHPDRFQWDFRTYYFAGQAFLLHVNPYDLGDMSRAVGHTVGFPFAYPPITLLAWGLLSRLPYHLAFTLYLFIKVFALVLLFALWTRYFLQGPINPMFGLVFLFGFGSASLIDLSAGNIAAFEALVIWSGLLALIKGRPWIFMGAVIVAATFKIAPILLLALILLVPSRRRLLFFFSGVGAFLVVNIIGFGAYPSLTRNFIAVASHLDSRGTLNPSALALARDLGDYAARKGITLPTHTPEVAFAFFSLMVIAVTLLVYRRSEDKTLWKWVMVGCITYAVVSPRFKNYSYMIVLLPAYLLVVKYLAPRWPALLVLLVLPSASLTAPFGLGNALSQVVWQYYSYLLVFGIWGLTMLAIHQDRAKGSRSLAFGRGPRLSPESKWPSPPLGNVEARSTLVGPAQSRTSLLCQDGLLLVSNLRERGSARGTSRFQAIGAMNLAHGLVSSGNQIGMASQ